MDAAGNVIGQRKLNQGIQLTEQQSALLFKKT